ncbi:MAG: hypothetical protein JWM34_2524 [Ilumatobacteraceae bacterium]|nr:hypothetical protein [Ilumatobacteraceae bacterium]
MAYDSDLADRIREILGIEPEVTEQRMFGGLAFLVGGHMAVAASGRGGLMVRIDRERSAALVASTTAVPMVMGGRTMAGWLRIETSELATRRQLTKWVRIGVDHARTLPPKSASRKRTR